MRRAILLPVMGAIGCGASPGVGRPSATPIDAFIAQRLEVSRYDKAEVDLDGDGVMETIVYATDADHCGSGGCSLYVLTPDHGGFRIVMNASVTRPPIRMLATRTHGWHDIGVFVAGGGILPGHDVRLRYDGTAYPGNPTIPPAKPASRLTGRVLIGR